MKRREEAHAVEMIPVERITVINPRVRNKEKFKEIVSNIAELGLKRPITVTRRNDTGPDTASSPAATTGARAFNAAYMGIQQLAFDRGGPAHRPVAASRHRYPDF